MCFLFSACVCILCCVCLCVCVCVFACMPVLCLRFVCAFSVSYVNVCGKRKYEEMERGRKQQKNAPATPQYDAIVGAHHKVLVQFRRVVGRLIALQHNKSKSKVFVQSWLRKCTREERERERTEGQKWGKGVEEAHSRIWPSGSTFPSLRPG